MPSPSPHNAARRSSGDPPDLDAPQSSAEPAAVELATLLDDGPPPQRVFIADSIEEAVEVVDERSIVTRAWVGLCWLLECLFGIASLIIGLSVLATIPIAQFLSLGYLLEVSGRVARTGRLRDGFVGVRKAARVGSMVMGAWLMLLPVRYVSDLWRSAQLIDPDSSVTTGWRIALIVLTVLTIAHILAAWYCGGRLRHFFWPLLAPLSLFIWAARKSVSTTAGLLGIQTKNRQGFFRRLLADVANVRPMSEWFLPAMLIAGVRRGRIYSESRDAVWDYVVSLHLPYYFWLGVRGFAGAVAWLFIPVLLLIAATTAEDGAAVLAGLIGVPLFMFVLLYLPFLQTHFAAERRMVAMFEWSEVRRMFRRAPIAFWFALLITLAFALPLYLLKIELVPQEAAWLPSLVFVVFIYPARLLTGWAVSRARRREKPRHFVFRWMSRLAALPVVAYFVLIVFFTRYTSWYGVWSLFEQHAFLVPVPFLGM